MAAEAAGDDVDSVDPNVVAGLHVTRGQAFGGNHDAPEAPGVERQSSGFFARASFHFDEGDGSTAPCNDVDFPAGDTCALGEDAPAVQAQPPTGERLGRAAALFRCFAIHFERSRARA